MLESDRERLRQRSLRLSFETVLLAIAAWGPLAIYDHRERVREIANAGGQRLRLLKIALREAGMDRADIEDLFIGGHPKACACWRCIMRIHNQVMRACALRLAQQEETTDE